MIYGKSLIFDEAGISYFHEVFFGKSETLLEIEDQFGKLREKTSDRFADINHDPELYKLNRLFEKQFGMDLFSLHIVKSDAINAYTCPVAMKFDIAFEQDLCKKVVRDKNGYRFKPNNHLCIICYIYTGLLCNQNITNGELVATILHEIGHNFADALDYDIDIANKKWAKQYVTWLTLNSLFIVTLPKNIADYVGWTNSYNYKKEKKDQSKKQNPVSGFFSGVNSYINDGKAFVNDIFNRVFKRYSVKKYRRMANIYGDPSNAEKSLSRRNEVIADKFAASYGYGPELVSGLQKMESEKSKAAQLLDKSGKGDINTEYDNDWHDLFKFDCHGYVLQRLCIQLDMLKKEVYNSTLDPKLVKELKQQIKILEKMKQETIKNLNDPKNQENAKKNYEAIKNNPEAMEFITKEIEKQIIDDFNGKGR